MAPCTPRAEQFCLSRYAKGFQFKHVPGGFSHAFWAYLVKNAYVYIFVFTIIQLAINLKCLNMPKETLKTPRLCELETLMVLMSKKSQKEHFQQAFWLPGPPPSTEHCLSGRKVPKVPSFPSAPASPPGATSRLEEERSWGSRVKADPMATLPNLCVRTTETSAYAKETLRIKSTKSLQVRKAWKFLLL